MQSIFISHTHADKAIADAIRDAMQALFGDKVIVHYSTNKELDGGIKPGEDWFRWIGARVRESSAAFVLLTPSSIQKPWVLWEAGAVAGAALASEGADQRKLRPISFKLRGSELPTPFGRDQVTDGLNKIDVKRMFADLLTHFASGLSPGDMLKMGEKLPSVCEDYLSKVVEALKLSPILVTEGAVQEWLDRIDLLEETSRFSETEELHDWLNVAFGRESSGLQRPLDLRIHRRLGELYARASQPERAAREFNLARQLAPRDVYILRKLGKAYLDQKRMDEAKEILDVIGELDPKAFVRNAENAALKARWHIAQNAFAAAIEVLKLAAESNPNSYYVYDLLGQTQLSEGRKDDAKMTYRQILTIVDKLRDQNVWILATGFNAALVLKLVDRRESFLRRLLDAKPTAEEVASIIRGAEKIAAAIDLDAETLTEMTSALRT